MIMMMLMMIFYDDDNDNHNDDDDNYDDNDHDNNGDYEDDDDKDDNKDDDVLLILQYELEFYSLCYSTTNTCISVSQIRLLYSSVYHVVTIVSRWPIGLVMNDIQSVTDAAFYKVGSTLFNFHVNYLINLLDADNTFKT